MSVYIQRDLFTAVGRALIGYIGGDDDGSAGCDCLGREGGALSYDDRIGYRGAGKVVTEAPCDVEPVPVNISQPMVRNDISVPVVSGQLSLKSCCRFL